MSGLYLEDFAVGQRFATGKRVLDTAHIKAFAAEFDPQPFHLDESAAETSQFGGLVASGWHTAALTMRLIVDSNFKPAGGFIGAGIEQFSWSNPLRPGDEIHVECEILEVRLSRSRPTQGILKLRSTTRNQNGSVVLVQVGNLMIPRRPSP